MAGAVKRNDMVMLTEKGVWKRVVFRDQTRLDRV